MHASPEGLNDLRADEVLDTFGLLCPIPIVKTAERVKTLKPGTVLEVISTDSGVVPDMQNWCRGHRHDYLGHRRNGRAYHVFLKVANRIS
jgi:tRNA 2-thiouridine synthesizing protein A